MEKYHRMHEQPEDKEIEMKAPNKPKPGESSKGQANTAKSRDREVENPQEEETEEARRENVKRFLHSHKVQVAVVILVIVDCALVMAELIIDLEIIKFHADQHYYLVSEILGYLSISILLLFLAELIAKLYAFRCEFFHHGMEVFDGIIIIVSLVLDIVHLFAHGVVTGLGLLIIFRLWRITRIINGIILSVKLQAEHRLEMEIEDRQRAEHDLEKYHDYSVKLEAENTQLRQLLRQNRVAEEKIAKIPHVIKPVFSTDNLH